MSSGRVLGRECSKTGNSDTRQEKTAMSQTNEMTETLNWLTWPVRALSRCTEVVGSIPGQDTYKSQPMNAWDGWNNRLLFLSFSLSLNSIN